MYQVREILTALIVYRIIQREVKKILCRSRESRTCGADVVVVVWRKRRSRRVEGLSTRETAVSPSKPKWTTQRTALPERENSGTFLGRTREPSTVENQRL